MATSQMLTQRSVEQIDWESPSNARLNFPDRFVSALLCNTWLSDMTFFLEINGTSLPAHSVIVAVASPVLERMCFNAIDSQEARVITVPAEYSVETAGIVLQHIYTGSGMCEINEVNASEIMKLADFFDLLDLQNQCARILKNTLNESNVCEFFDQFHHTNNDLMPMCLEIIQEYAENLFNDGSIMRMRHSAVKIVLEQDLLDIADETIIIRSMIDWAKVQCIEKEFSPDPQNCRKLLDKLVGVVRFPTMTSGQFITSLSIMGGDFLSANEMFEISQNMLNNESKSKLPGSFSALPRSRVLEDMKYDIKLQQQTDNKYSEQITIQVPTDIANGAVLTGFGICPVSSCIPHIITDVSISGASEMIPFHYEKPNVVFLKPLPLNEQNMCSFTLISLKPYKIFSITQNKSIPHLVDAAATSISYLNFKVRRHSLNK